MQPTHMYDRMDQKKLENCITSTHRRAGELRSVIHNKHALRHNSRPATHASNNSTNII